MEAFLVLALVVAFIGQCTWLSIRSIRCLIHLQRTGAIREALANQEYRRADAPGKFWFLTGYHSLMAVGLGSAVAFMVVALGGAFIPGQRG